jgi:transcriptional regulator with XRE-family HTH domain
MFLAQQVRALRGDMSQQQFAELLGTTQSVVSRFEDPSYGKFNLQTLLEIAAKLDRAVVARIVDFPTFLRFTEDVSANAMCPAGYDAELLDQIATGLASDESAAAIKAPQESVLRATRPARNQHVSSDSLLGQTDFHLGAESYGVDTRLAPRSGVIESAWFDRRSASRGITSH